MRLFEQDTTTPGAPWPFTGREKELDLVRRALTAGRPGAVITGPAGRGKTRLAAEVLRGTGCARVTGTPQARDIPFAAFAHLLPGPVTLHGAVRHLSGPAAGSGAGAAPGSGTGVKVLLVDDAHLLDDSSAALVHQLAVHGRVRLLVVVADDGPVPPPAVSRLWTGELLPRLPLEPLSCEDTAALLTAATGAVPEALTTTRLHRLCRGDLRLLRTLVTAVRDGGPAGADTAPRDGDPVPGEDGAPGAGEWTWRGPVPVTGAVRERAAAVLSHPHPAARDTLERLAFAEPLPLPLRLRPRVDDGLEDDPNPQPGPGPGLDPGSDPGLLGLLEQLEADALIRVDDHGAVRLAHPLHGPVLRAAAGRLRAARLTRKPARCAAALDAEAAALLRRIEVADVRALPTPVGDWLAEEGEPVPAGYAALRARFSRLRGELRDAVAWAREGLRGAPDDAACRLELALSAAQSGDLATAHAAFPGRPVPARAATWLAAARADVTDALRAVDDTDPHSRYDAVRIGAAGRLTGVPLPAGEPFAQHALALAQADGPSLDRAARALEERGFLLFAAEAHAQAVRAHRDPRAARLSRTRATALARRCQGARTPALSGLALGELTARQRQIVTLAAAGLSNRRIAEQLTLSVRTVGNHLHAAYTRLGASDRGALPWLTDLPGAAGDGTARAVPALPEPSV
ncbi:LuxR C-terminal-related transcriptional regulator [Streptomyces sp. NPDC047000]|uniref:helix-turn-helix transcriptional regulator n=1 Tax=Streptomyces sp. NPDC047000 TaxID=3155474 RepID=UPI0033CF8221